MRFLGWYTYTILVNGGFETCFQNSFEPFSREENGSPKMQFFLRIMIRFVEGVKFVKDR